MKVTFFTKMLFVAFMAISVSAKAQVHNGHKYVDLDLTSGTLWATCNIGATNPEDYGDYYAWGETTTKTTYTKSNYTVDGNPEELEVANDAAAQNWGGNWRMPSKKQFEELIQECYWVWTPAYGKNMNSGYIVYKAKSEKDKGKIKSSKNSSSVRYSVYKDVHIFLPASGYRGIGNIGFGGEGEGGYYWSRSLYEDYTTLAWDLFFNSDYVETGYSNRDSGQSVRPVCPRAE